MSCVWGDAPLSGGFASLYRRVQSNCAPRSLLGGEGRGLLIFGRSMTLVVASIYAGIVLLCVGATALLVRTWTRRRYWHKSPSDLALHPCRCGAALSRWNWSNGRFATRGRARPHGIGHFSASKLLSSQGPRAARCATKAAGSGGCVVEVPFFRARVTSIGPRLFL